MKIKMKARSSDLIRRDECKEVLQSLLDHNERFAGRAAPPGLYSLLMKLRVQVGQESDYDTETWKQTLNWEYKVYRGYGLEFQGGPNGEKLDRAEMLEEVSQLFAILFARYST